jgi:hypothetical protein
MLNRVNKNGIGRRRATMLGMLIVFTLLLCGNSQDGRAQEFGGAIVDVVPDAASLLAVPQNGSFYLKGSIYGAGSVLADGTLSASANAVGKWYCWGHSDNGLLVGNCSYNLDSFNGSLQIQGRNGDSKLAIVGGAGKFKGALGDADIKPLGSGGAFRAYFNFVNKPSRFVF